jgi:TRAP-type C4-dicarboxylate transport system permease small subunit
MRSFLDWLYKAAGVLAAACLALIALLVVVQLGGRIVDGALKLVGLPPRGFVILSLAEFAGYLLAAASFLALAPTLKAGAHIRVTMLLSAVGEERRKPLEIVALIAAVIFSGFLTIALGRLALDSWRFNEVSTGLVPVQLVYPQAAMTLGLVILTVAFLDELGIVLARGRPSFRSSEDAVTLGKEG